MGEILEVAITAGQYWFKYLSRHLVIYETLTAIAGHYPPSRKWRQQTHYACVAAGVTNVPVEFKLIKPGARYVKRAHADLATHSMYKAPTTIPTLLA